MRFSLITAGRRELAVLLGILLFHGILAGDQEATAALQKPIYAAGDRWTYVVQGSLAAFPGLNATDFGDFELRFNGLVQVEIMGPTTAGVGHGSAPAVAVTTRSSGYLNGTLRLPAIGTITASGTFASDVKEVREGRAYLPVVTNATSRYVIDITYLLSTQIRVDLFLNISTTYSSIPSFELDVGETATAPFTMDTHLTSRVTAFGNTTSFEDRRSLTSNWTREVLGRENVTVEAGVFSAYRLNGTLGAFPALGILAPDPRANESGWYSNDVGNYVERRAWLNGTPLAEMRLKSYAYGATPAGRSFLELGLLLATPAGGSLAVLWILRRRKMRRGEAKGPYGSPRMQGGPIGGGRDRR